MPTFKLDDLDDSTTYGGDNDMYFRQWRVPSMKPVLNKKLDRDFQKAISKKEDSIKKRADAKKKHDEKFERKLEALNQKMSEAAIPDKENKPFLRAPTEMELKQRRDELNKEYESPSSTAPAHPAGQKLRPRVAPVFGSNMAGLKNLVLPPTTTSSVLGSLPRKPTLSESSTGTGTPKDNSFLNSSHETVFFPQTHNSFNLDHYNGTRPSFAFAGLNAATSTPLSKSHQKKFSIGSLKITEEGNDSVFEGTKYVTAIDSPQTTTMVEKIQMQKLQAEEEAKRKEEERKLREEEAKKALDLQKAQEEKVRKAMEAKKALEQQRVIEAEDRRAAEDAKARRTKEEEEETHKAKKSSPSQFTPPFKLFKNYIALEETLLKEKASYERTSDPARRSLLKRTITERISVFTNRQTSTQMRGEILEFFKNMLQKAKVDGFSLGTEAPKVQLETDEDVNYAVYSIVHRYVSLAVSDVELAPTISDLISRLSSVIRRVEKVFIVMLFNKSALLRQDPKECRTYFVDSRLESDDKARLLNEENALITLFFNVFVKNAYISSKGRKMVLDEDLLWRYADSAVEHAPEVPKAPMVLLQLIQNCEPRLRQKEERWNALLEKISSETIPQLEEETFAGDESVIGRLKQLMTALRR
ncbi:unnamed protein product [Caenorhabditis sp. 36 PRJEB53466]|nr:unnamed protein product [Caenorhabditis sp. 36 PRJEB53466]